MMESVGLKIIDRRLIWLKDDGSYEVRYIPRLDEKIMDYVFKNKQKRVRKSSLFFVFLFFSLLFFFFKITVERFVDFCE